MRRALGFLLGMLSSSTGLSQSEPNADREPEHWQCATASGQVVAEGMLNWIDGEVVGVIIIRNAFYPARVTWKQDRREWTVDGGGKYRLVITDDTADDEDGFHKWQAHDGRFHNSQSPDGQAVICSPLGPSVILLGRSL